MSGNKGTLSRRSISDLGRRVYVSGYCDRWTKPQLHQKENQSCFVSRQRNIHPRVYTYDICVHIWQQPITFTFNNINTMRARDASYEPRACFNSHGKNGVVYMSVASAKRVGISHIYHCFTNAIQNLHRKRHICSKYVEVALRKLARD